MVWRIARKELMSNLLTFRFLVGTGLCVLLVGVMTPALLAAPGIAEKAKADVRVKATVQTPAVRIHVTNSPARHYVKGPRPVKVTHVYRISKHDRVIALRLAHYAGVPARRIVLMRERGLSWAQIGNRLSIPQYVVRAAFNARSWERFMIAENRRGGCGTVTYHNERVVTAAFNDFFSDGELNDLGLTLGDLSDDD